MSFNELTISDLVVIIGSLMAIISFATRIASPITALNKRIEKIEEHQNADNERLKALEGDCRMILKATRVLVAHSVNGNSTGELKRIQNEMDEYLINK